ncbi:hypothetical protein NC652_002292 [Populus alba x Populus x berolinensis]|nr:hypothetical protein NC652_002292 [Populus alba x Populus x berolinensis]
MNYRLVSIQVVQLVGMLGLRLLIFHILLVCYNSHKDST